MYLRSNGVSDMETTGAERACRSRASRNCCDVSIVNPKRVKNAALARPAGTVPRHQIVGHFPPFNRGKLNARKRIDCSGRRFVLSLPAALSSIPLR